MKDDLDNMIMLYSYLTIPSTITTVCTGRHLCKLVMHPHTSMQIETGLCHFSVCILCCFTHTVRDQGLNNSESVISVCCWLLFCLLVFSYTDIVTNPVYHLSPAGDAVYHYAEVESKPAQSIYHNYRTLEPDSAYQENPLQYEVPVPQQRNVHKSNEVGKRETCLRIMRPCIMNAYTFLHIGICHMLQLGTLRSNRGM